LFPVSFKDSLVNLQDYGANQLSQTSKGQLLLIRSTFEAFEDQFGHRASYESFCQLQKKLAVNECDTKRQAEDFKRLRQHLEFEELNQLNVLTLNQFPVAFDPLGNHGRVHLRHVGRKCGK